MKPIKVLRPYLDYNMVKCYLISLVWANSANERTKGSKPVEILGIRCPGCLRTPNIYPCVYIVVQSGKPVSPMKQVLQNYNKGALTLGNVPFPKEYIKVFAKRKVAVLDNFRTLTTMAKGRKKVTKSGMQAKGHKDEMKTFIASAFGRCEAPFSFESLHATTLSTFRILQALETNTVIEIPPCP
jgi:hypothetical protein